jgi:hypothetical protein
MGYKGRVGRVSAGGLTEEKEKRREQASCWAGVFGSKISLGCEENGKRIWNLWLQIWIWIKALNPNQRYFQILKSLNLIQK